MFKVLKSMLFFEASNEVIKVIRLIILATVLHNFIAWRLLKTFGTEFWEDGNINVQISELLGPTIDGGYLAFLANIFLFWCTLLAGYLSITRFRNTLIIPLTYLIVFIEDSLSIHEKFDKIIISFFDIINFQINPFFLNFIQQFAELIFWSIPLIIIFIWILLSTKRNIQRESIKFITTNILFFGIFAFFGIVIDQLNPILYELGGNNLSDDSFLRIIQKSLNVVEEFGECFSIGLAFLWMLNLLSYDKTIKSPT